MTINERQAATLVCIGYLLGSGADMGEPDQYRALARQAWEENEAIFMGAVTLLEKMDVGVTA